MLASKLLKNLFFSGDFNTFPFVSVVYFSTVRLVASEGSLTIQHTAVHVLKLSGCVKYFADEAAWAITNHSMCNFWIERKEFQPGCYSGFALFAKNTSVKNSKAKQTGWIREDDKPIFLEFTRSIDDIEELSIEFSSGVIRRENRGIEIVVTVSK